MRESKAVFFDEAFDGRKLAKRIEEECDSLEKLQNLLREEVCAVKWLDRLYQSLKDNGLNDVIDDCCLVPNQDGDLDKLSNLYRDQNIAEELKDIAKLLDWPIQRKVRDKRLTFLTDEVGAGDWSSEYVVGELLKKLQERAEKKPDDDFANASVRLFTWLVGRKDWGRLHGFPVFAKENDSDKRRVFRLELSEEDDNQPLAPIGIWSEDLQPFSDLFPQRHILADDFFEAVPNSNVWRILDGKGFIRADVIIKKGVDFDKFFPDEPLPEGEHKTVDPVTVTDIAFLTKKDIGIIDRVRGSRPLAQKFWCFLTEWVVMYDSEGLEVKEAVCECAEEQKHRYFHAKWLVPLVERKWVPLEDGRRDKATAQSLARLLQDSKWDPNSLNANTAPLKLLEAIGVTRFDLMRELVSKSDEDRAEMNNQLTYLITATGGDFSHVRKFVEDLQDDEELPEILKKRREDRQMVRKNQHLGQCVEDLVKESLEDEGFTVERTGTGSDYEIELEQEGQSWLVEVKSTQGQEVRMTDTQAETAAQKENRFLLCVVPVESSQPELDEVRDKMRFVANIGSRVEPLCNDLDEFKNLRDEITDDNVSGVQLVVEAGTARVRVASSVWEKDGFQLEHLAERLKEEGT